MAVPDPVLENHIRIAGQLAVSEDPGRVVRGLRERFGFTQEQLAGLLRMRRESLSRIEGGRVAPSTGFIQRLASIMALTQVVREHLAEGDARGAAIDDAYLQRTALGLRLQREVADEVVLAAMMGYEQKKRGILKILEERA
ncbi:MAG: helix-turn-helix domain-containing protein [Halobacteriales archaeon]|nr:helix-turn-helix domain-containing protein [Halobacteriales archaeon]